MSFHRRLFLLVSLLTLAATRGRAQERPTAPAAQPAPSQQVMTLRVTLPTAVGYVMRLLTKDEQATKPAGQTAPRTNNPVMVFTVPLPQLLTGKKADAPAAPKKD